MGSNNRITNFKGEQNTIDIVRSLPASDPNETRHKKKPVIPKTRARRLAEELKLIHSYSSDTVYRLGYDSMSYDYISPAVEKLLGYSATEMKKINFRSLILETKLISDNLKTVNNYQELEDTRKKGHVGKWQADYLMRHKDGRKIWVTDISHPWIDENGKVIGSVGTLRDITDRVIAEKKHAEELVRLASTDALTGLYIRSEFFKSIEHELKRLPKSKSEFSILLINMDNLKNVNDVYGHNIGDSVIKQFVTLMNSCLRNTDMACRISGDEFGVFMPDTKEKAAFWVADHICRKAFKHKFSCGNGHVAFPITVSIGVAAANHKDAQDASLLYKIADTRLYIAKKTGRNQVSVDEVVN